MSYESGSLLWRNLGFSCMIIESFNSEKASHSLIYLWLLYLAKFTFAFGLLGP